MFNKSTIETNFSGLVGFDNPVNPDYQKVSAANQLSSSDRKYTDNDYCKIEYLYDLSDYPNMNDTQFNTVLSEINNKAIISVMDKVFDEPDFVDRQVQYQNANNKINTEDFPTTGSLVVHKINIDKTKNIAFEITRVMLEFNGTGTIKLMLFNSSVLAPIKSQEVTINSGLVTTTLNWKVDNSGDYYKGEFYIGYLTAGHTLKPYKRDYNNSNIMSVITHLEIQTGYFPNHTTETLPDLNNFDGSSESWGINMDITVYDDFTDTAIQNKSLFAEAIGKQGEVNIISSFLASLRSNAKERVAKETITRMMVELDGIDVEDGVKKYGLKKELFFELNRIKKKINKLKDGYVHDGLTVETIE